MLHWWPCNAEGKGLGDLLIQHFVTMMASSPLLSAFPQHITSHFSSLPWACAYPVFPRRWNASFTCSTVRLMPAGANFHLCMWASPGLNVLTVWYPLYSWIKSVPVVSRLYLGSWPTPACRFPPRLDSSALVHTRHVASFADAPLEDGCCRL